MTDRRKDREEKLQRLKDGTLIGKQKADFYYKMSKILERELIRLEELSALLDATPDNYLENIDFRERAIAAMSLTQKLIDKTDHAPIIEMNGIKYATKQYLLTSFPGLTGLDNSIMVYWIKYEPIAEDLIFDKQLKESLQDLNIVVNGLLDQHPHTTEEFHSEIAPRMGTHSKTGKFHLVGSPVILSPETVGNKEILLDDFVNTLIKKYKLDTTFLNKICSNPPERVAFVEASKEEPGQ